MTLRELLFHIADMNLDIDKEIFLDICIEADQQIYNMRSIEIPDAENAIAEKIIVFSVAEPAEPVESELDTVQEEAT